MNDFPELKHSGRPVPTTISVRACAHVHHITKKLLSMWRTGPISGHIPPPLAKTRGDAPVARRRRTPLRFPSQLPLRAGHAHVLGTNAPILPTARRVPRCICTWESSALGPVGPENRGGLASPP